MLFKIFPPSPLLQAYVQGYALLQHENNQIMDPIEDFVAPGLGKGLIFVLNSDENTWVTNRNFQFKITSGYFMPQNTQFYRMHLSRHVKMLAVLFHPGQFRQFFTLPADELVDHKVITFEESGLDHLNILQEQMRGLGSIRSKLDLLDQYLCNQLCNRDQRYTLTDEFLKKIRGENMPSIDRLARQFGVSDRYLRRIFTQEIGINPKLFLRVRRFNISFHMLKSGKYEKLSDIAYDLGYSDQSHFIREFRQFTGTTPLQFFKEKHPLQNKLFWRDAL